jgi:hypothetical protein
MLSVAILATAAPALADDGYKSFVGHFRWNAKDSYYAMPAAYGKPLPDLVVDHDSPAGIKLHERAFTQDGKQSDWYFDAPYDGAERKGDWIIVKMKRLTPDSIGNEWYMTDGKVKGYEVDRITGDRITNTGVQIDEKGNMYPYVEIWDRVKD